MIGHSHGGNVTIIVANILAQNGIKVETLVTIATPVREYQLDKGVTVGQHINVYNNSDQVQIRGGHVGIHIASIALIGVEGYKALLLPSAGRKFSKAINKNAEDAFDLFSPIGSHSSMHSNIKIWEKYITPLIKK